MLQINRSIMTHRRLLLFKWLMIFLPSVTVTLGHSLMQHTGDGTHALPPLAATLPVTFLGLVLTEFLSNNAVAVIYTPVAIELAHRLGYDPRPFVVAVMFSATLAFATPVGYQTNMMVYGPGGYRFSDFTKVGLPLNIIVMLVACALIPLIWPL